MTPADLLLTVVASAAGWAVLLLALVMLRMMDMRNGRWLTAAAWALTAMAGAWLATVPGFRHEAPHWAMAMLAAGLAVTGWTNLKALLAQATRRERPNPLGSVAALGLLAGCMVIAPALALEVKGNTFILSDSDLEACAEEGGCSVFTLKYVTAMYEKAKAAGKAECRANRPGTI